MRLHEKNQAFDWRPANGPYRRLTDEQARQYDEQGFFLLEDVFTREEIEVVCEAIDPFEAEYEAFLKERFNGQLFIAKADAITFTIHMVMKTAVAKAFSRHEVFADICHDTLGPGARLYWDQAVYKKPENPEEFPWHQDNGYTFTEPQQYLTCWVPLTDTDERNGCPWVVPGVHKLGTLHHEKMPLGLACLEDPEETVAVPAKVGDVVVFSSLTPHRTGPNLTNATRKAYILQYAPDGAVVHAHDGSGVSLCNNPQRQYPVEA